MAAEDARAAYAAIVDYHNGLVQTRFTVAGLYLAANGFLASGYFQSASHALPWFSLPSLGVALTVVCWLLELRTYQLLSNLSTRGSELEGHLGIAQSHGFFALMADQTVPARFLILPGRISKNRFSRRVIAHSFGLGLLYGIVAIFWLTLLVLHI